MEIMNIDRKCRARSRCSFYDVRPRCRSNSFSTLDHLTKLPSVMDWARNSFSLEIQKSCNISRKKSSIPWWWWWEVRIVHLSAEVVSYHLRCAWVMCFWPGAWPTTEEPFIEFVHYSNLKLLYNAYKPTRALSQERQYAYTVRTNSTGKYGP